jgi:hypothetical protein
MGTVIDLARWRGARAGHPAGRGSASTPAVVAQLRAVEPRVGRRVASKPGGARAAEGPPPDERELDKLERAVERLHPLVSSALKKRRTLPGPVETELLAIMGELTMGLVREATKRADRLAASLGSERGAATD